MLYLIKINNKLLRVVRASKYNILESAEGYGIHFIDKNSDLISSFHYKDEIIMKTRLVRLILT